jgi:hypothetical protein
VSLPPVRVTVDQLPVNTPQVPFERPIASRWTVIEDAFTPDPPPLSVTEPSETPTEGRCSSRQ